MSYEEFRRHLARAAISTRDFAALLRMNPNSVSNYASSGAVPAHLAVIAALIADMSEHGLDFRRTLSTVDLSRKKPRGARSVLR